MFLCSPVRRLFRRHALIAALTLITWAGLAVHAHAASVSGDVRTTDGRPLPHAVVTLKSASTSASALTGPEGGFRVDLPPGSYAVALEAPGLVVTHPTALAVEATGATGVLIEAAAAPVREEVLVTATRSEALSSTLGMSVSVLDRQRLGDQDAATVLRAIEEVPGIAVARAGGVGPQASMFVRGGESRFAAVLVDGVPVNEPGGSINLGTLLPLEIEQVEVLRGAASSLYGTDALAGVVQVVTRTAGRYEEPNLHGTLEGGSFDSWRLQGATSGRRAGWDWNLGGQRIETANQEPNSDFRQTAGALALGRGLGERTSLRVVARADTSKAGVPGPTAFQRPDLDASYERTTAIASALLRFAGGRLTHEVRAGFSRANQLSINPEDSGPYTPTFGDLQGFGGSDYPNPEGYQNDTRRLNAGYQVEAQLGRMHLVTFGCEATRETGEIGDRREALLAPHRTNAGVYAQDRLVLGDNVFATVGGRVEHNGSFGTRAVPRVSLAWRVRPGANATTLRASAGAGIKEPSFLESYGVSQFARGNPDLAPERSRTFDVGIDQHLLDGRLRGEGTLFHQDYENQIAYFVESYDPFTGSYHNLGRTQARGAELALDAAPRPQLTLHAAYTFLDGRVVDSAPDADPIYAVGQPLLRRPKHQASLSAQSHLGRLSAGVTLVIVGKRADSDFGGLGLTQNDGYRRLDARLRWELGRGLELAAAADNLTNAKYMEILGYPALGRAIRGGLRWRLGGGQQR